MSASLGESRSELHTKSCVSNWLPVSFVNRTAVQSTFSRMSVPSEYLQIRIQRNEAKQILNLSIFL